jgi:DNA-binding protein HU-beta
MTKAELIEVVAHETGAAKKTVASILDEAFAQIARAIRKEKRFWVPGFGTFSVRKRNARKGFDPSHQKPITIPAMRSIGFRAAPQLKKGIQESAARAR